MTDRPSDPPREPDPVDLEYARRLASERPVPSAGFRGALGRRLISLDPGYGPRPVRLRLHVAGLLLAGSLVLLLGVLISAGTV